MNQRVVTGGFIVSNNKFLLVKRADNDTFYPGVWEIPGGKLEFGEATETGLRRELKEEVGLEVEIISPISVWDYTNQENSTQYVEIDFLCKYKGDSKVIISEEHSDFKWVTFDELDNFDISPPAKQLLLSLKNHPLILSAFKAV